MTSIVQQWDYPFIASRALSLPDFNAALLGETMSIERLPAESIGTFVATLTNLVVGSVIRIELQAAGTLVELRTAASTTEVFSVPAYVNGSAGNDLRIKVRKGSAAPKYLPFETLSTAFVGSASIYIAQTADPIA